MKIGIDIQDAREFKKPERIFTASELEYLATKNNSTESMAGIYAAKEAFFKAVGTGVQKNQLQDVEILHKDTGEPYIVLHNSLKENYEWANILVSISHTKTTAVSVCLLAISS